MSMTIKHVKYIEKYSDFERYVGKCAYNNFQIEKRISKDKKNVVLVYGTTRGRQLAFRTFTIAEYNNFCESIDENDDLNNLEFLVKMMDYLFRDNSNEWTR